MVLTQTTRFIIRQKGQGFKPLRRAFGISATRMIMQ